MLSYYNKIDLQNNCILSCDMLRLSFRLSDEDAKKFNKYINQTTLMDFSVDVKIFSNLQLYKFRNLITITKKIDNGATISFCIRIQVHRC